LVKGVEIRFFKEISARDIEGFVFITGFQGFGLVGYLASRHIVDQLGLERIGYVRTSIMPENTLYIKDKGLLYPFELYYGERSDKKIMVLVNHATPHVRERTDYAEKIVAWLGRNGVSEVILIGGLDPSIREREDEKYRWIPIDGCRKKLEAPVLYDRFVVGPLALFMMFAYAYRIPGYTVLAYTELYRPDPRASAVAVEAVSQILGFEIDTRELLEEAKVLESIEKEERLRKMIEGEVKPEHPGFSMHV